MLSFQLWIQWIKNIIDIVLNSSCSSRFFMPFPISTILSHHTPHNFCLPIESVFNSIVKVVQGLRHLKQKTSPHKQYKYTCRTHHTAQVQSKDLSQEDLQCLKAQTLILGYKFGTGSAVTNRTCWKQCIYVSHGPVMRL